ncbi:MAG: MFS transporter [Roseburia sp.]|nr:MFS transporter [Roseburia sp.]
MAFKLTKSEVHWILYDVGNSAFILLVSTMMPVYFKSLVNETGLTNEDYLAYWGYAASFVTLIVAALGPVLGTLTDNKGFKKPLFFGTVAAGAVGCALLGFAKGWLAFLIIFIIAKAAYSISLIFYDAMLPDVTTGERVDRVSALGYAWGYIGSCIPFILCLVLVLGAESFGLTMGTAMMISFMITSLWWVALTIPVMKSYRQKYYVEGGKSRVSESFLRLWRTLRHARQKREILWFLIAFFFYIDGVHTIIDMATTYGGALGLDSTGLLLALLLTQFVAFPCAVLFGRLAQRYATEGLLGVCIIAYLGIAIFAVFLHNLVQFWILAVLVGMFQGGIQALSRSYYTKIIPPEQSGEFFGIYDIFGKGAAFLGTTLVGVVSQATGSINTGISVLSVLFLLGLLAFWYAVKLKKEKE